ncbi:zinc-binding dehydrogenase [Gemmatimonas sp.]|jgi:NADPH:quinone reductase-like Zn-dependent oxidoreductase|uniref:zinc-binding dehydrogenase n=1 Tax=Gemmatimonas sp. TaxID=1962908 RepID=UPI0037BFE006
MQHVVIYGAQQPTIASARRDHVTVDGVRVGCGLAPARRPAFDPHDAAQRTQVLVEVLGFSCNYRDKAFFVVMGSLPSSRCTPVGSEFVGRVVAVGDAVEALAVGDRVMPDQHYAGNTAARRPLAAGEAREGVATNQSSRRWIVLPAIKLRRVPDAMSTATAATFGLNAQTAYAMVRKAELSAGKTALIFGASSNTSLFLAGAARAVGARVVAATTRESAVPKLRALGVSDVLVTDRHWGGAARREAFEAFVGAVGGVDAALDPFYDLHIALATEVLSPGGRYVTCGLAGQNEYSAAQAAAEPLDAHRILRAAMFRNLSLIGNCIGTHDDLTRALNDYRNGQLSAVVDRVYQGGDSVGDFFDRTFNAPDRFGKVVYLYGDAH